jgi:hypothetical protein
MNSRRGCMIYLFIILIILIFVATAVSAWGTYTDNKKLAFSGQTLTGLMTALLVITQLIDQARSSKGLEDKINLILTAQAPFINAQNPAEAKAASETIGQVAKLDPQFTKGIIEAAGSNPATARTIGKAVGLSPALEEAIKQVDPNSQLLPEDKTISSGYVNIERGYGRADFELKIEPNTTLINRTGGNNFSYVGTIFKPGDPINISYYYIGLDIGSGSATINGRKYEEIFYGGDLSISTEATTVPFTNAPTLTIRVASSIGGTLLGLSKSVMSAESEDTIFRYRLHGQGTATIELARDESVNGYNFVRVRHQF